MHKAKLPVIPLTEAADRNYKEAQRLARERRVGRAGRFMAGLKSIGRFWHELNGGATKPTVKPHATEALQPPEPVLIPGMKGFEEYLAASGQFFDEHREVERPPYDEADHPFGVKPGVEPPADEDLAALYEDYDGPVSPAVENLISSLPAVDHTEEIDERVGRIVADLPPETQRVVEQFSDIIGIRTPKDGWTPTDG